MFCNHTIADFIAITCLNIDIKCRQELNLNTIVSERDYVTALSTRIRDNLKIQNNLACHSQTLRAKQENENGVDGIIVFKYKENIKAGIFEAKRPQLTLPNHNWDELTIRNTSHFSEQIQNQHKWHGKLAIWEMFFNEGKPGFMSPFFQVEGSTCVWHINAHDFMHSKKLIFNKWKTAHLNLLLKTSSQSFYSIIYDLIICNAGIVHPIDTKSMTAVVKAGNSSLPIPLPFNQNGDFDGRIESFLNENKFYNYTYVDLNEIEENLFFQSSF